MSDALNVSLVGRMHRTVFVEGCNPNFYDELATLFARKCGRIEARGMVGTRYAVVFEQYNNVSNAVAMHGMSFIDLHTKLLIWAADKTPPSEATQLALGGAAPATSAAERSAATEARRERIEAFLKLGGGGSTSDGVYTNSAAITAAERDMHLYRLCIRQMKALSVIMEFDKERLQKEQTALQESTVLTEGVIQRLRGQQQSAASQGTAGQ